MKLAWASDIHLEFLDQEEEWVYFKGLLDCDIDVLLLGGDISIARRLMSDLIGIVETLRVPTLFVLGNHDYYGGSIAGIRKIVGRFVEPPLEWLPGCGPVTLTEGVGLVGHGGWGDARLGDFAASGVVLNDYVQIRELQKVFDEKAFNGVFGRGTELEKTLNGLGRQAARTLGPQLEMAALDHDQILILTHVPPFREACWHEGKISGDDYLPAFACGALGGVIRDAAGAYPEKQFTVLCGHTHSEGGARILPNLTVHTQGARYGEPGFRLLEATATGVRLLP